MTDPSLPIIPGRPEPTPPQLPPGHPLAPPAQPVAYPTAPPPNKSTNTLMWVLIAVGAVVLAVVGCCGFIAIKTIDDQSSAISDVSISLCASTSYGAPRAFVHVANSTSASHDYQVTVAFESGNTQLDTGIAVVNDLGAGQTADVEAIGFGTKNAGAFTCRVTNVTRV